MISKIADDIIDASYKVKQPDGKWVNIPGGKNADKWMKSIAFDNKMALPHFFTAGLRGFTRAMDLSDDERKLLIDHYNLPEDASLGMRNAGRGMAGMAIGGIPAWLVYKAISRDRHPNWKTIAAILSGASGVVGAEATTEKYSPTGARDIQARIR